MRVTKKKYTKKKKKSARGGSLLLWMGATRETEFESSGSIRDFFGRGIAKYKTKHDTKKKIKKKNYSYRY